MSGSIDADEQVTFSVGSTGTFYIQVQGWYSGGPYTLSVKRLWRVLVPDREVGTSSRDDVGELRRSLPAISASVPVVIVYFAVLGIVLTAAGPNGLALDAGQTSAWIALLYGWPTLLALVLTIRYRQPLLLTGNIFAIIFFVTLGDRLTFPELAGAAIVAGAILPLALLGVTDRIGAWMPQIVQGLIAGVVLPFVVNVFTALSTSEHGNELPLDVPVMVGAALLAYLLTQRFLAPRIPPILPAFVAGILVAAVTGQLGAFPSTFAYPVWTWSGRSSPGRRS